MRDRGRDASRWSGGEGRRYRENQKQHKGTKMVMFMEKKDQIHIKSGIINVIMDIEKSVITQRKFNSII